MFFLDLLSGACPLMLSAAGALFSEYAGALALFTGLSNLFIVGLGAAAGLIAMEVKTRRDLS